MKIKSGFVLEKVGEEYLAVAVGDRANEFSGFIRLNSTGAYFFKLMTEKDVTKEDIVKTVMSEFVGVSEEQVSRDVDNITSILRDGGILE
jgi:hypothetical protein